MRICNLGLVSVNTNYTMKIRDVDSLNDFFRAFSKVSAAQRVRVIALAMIAYKKNIIVLYRRRAWPLAATCGPRPPLSASGIGGTARLGEAIPSVTLTVPLQCQWLAGVPVTATHWHMVMVHGQHFWIPLVGFWMFLFGIEEPRNDSFWVKFWHRIKSLYSFNEF